MKVAPAILLYFFIREISAYTITKIEGINNNERAVKVNIDANGNTYVLTKTENQIFKLYKLNPSNEITSVVDLPHSVSEMRVSSRGDVYFFFKDKDKKIILGILQKDSVEIETRPQNVTFNSLFYLDNKDNLFYSTKKSVNVIRSGSTTSVPVKNLEDYVAYATEVTVSDKSGITYLPVIYDSKYSLAVINMQEEIPQATLINAFENTTRIDHLAIDGENNLWMSTWFLTEKESTVKRLKNGILKTFMTEKVGSYETVPSKDKIYVISDVKQSIGYISYITSNEEVVGIPELANLRPNFYPFKGIADSEGRVYFYKTSGTISKSMGRMVIIEPGEITPKKIRLGTRETIKTVEIDFNGNLWIVLEKGVIHLRKGESAPNLVKSLEEKCNVSKGHIHFNFVTKKIYFSCSDGLVIIEDA